MMDGIINWIKRCIAPKEMAELDRWRTEWQNHRQWFAEFPSAACALDHMKCDVYGEPVTNIMTVRDSCRVYYGKAKKG